MTHPTDDHPRTTVRAPSRGPRILIASGIALLGLAVAAGLFSALKFVDLLPFEVLTADGELVVRGPDGKAVDVASGPSVSGSIERGGRDVRTVAGLTVTEHGTYTFEVPEQDGDGRVTALVTTDAGVPAHLTGTAGTMGLGVLAVGLGLAGLGLVTGGAITTWSRRSQVARPATRP